MTKYYDLLFVFGIFLHQVTCFSRIRPLGRIRGSKNILHSINDISFTESAEIADNTLRVFEPQLPSADILYGFGGITVFLSIAAYFWWTSVIPQKRTELAISKSRGEINDLLTDLESETSSPNSDGDASIQRNFQKWLLSDWLQQRKKRTVKPAAIPFLKKAKWNSGDNPILVAFGGIMAFVIAASLAERTFH